MMDWTDRHCRYFMRLLTPSVLLYTEMVTAAAIHHGDRDASAAFQRRQSTRWRCSWAAAIRDWMASATRMPPNIGYDEININVGCPSDRVQSGQFGACLMAQPDVVAECLRAMQAETTCPVTVKTRIGIDDHDSDEFLWHFVETMACRGAAASSSCTRASRFSKDSVRRRTAAYRR